MRLTDRQTDTFFIASRCWHSMQRGKTKLKSAINTCNLHKLHQRSCHCLHCRRCCALQCRQAWTI